MSTLNPARILRQYVLMHVPSEDIPDGFFESMDEWATYIDEQQDRDGTSIISITQGFGRTLDVTTRSDRV